MYFIFVFRDGLTRKFQGEMPHSEWKAFQINEDLEYVRVVKRHSIEEEYTRLDYYRHQADTTFILSKME